MDYEQIWFRHNDTAVDASDDGALLALIERAQMGDDEAMAGVMVAMAENRASLLWKFRGRASSTAGSRDDAYEATGQLSSGWVDSSLALAVVAFDCAVTENVGRRLYLDARYILRAPGRRVEATVGVIAGEQETAHLAASTRTVENTLLSTGEQWLRNKLWADARGRESDERFAEMVEAIVLVWLHESTVVSAAAEVGVKVDSLKFYLKRSKAILATDEVRLLLAS